MTTATVTAAALVATADMEVLPTADDFRAALAAASVAGDTSAAATATLHAISLQRYVTNAQRYIVQHDDTAVLPESDRKNVAALVWLEATGSITSPSAADRTPGETSLGQYISRYGTVATDLAYGMDYLAGTDSVDEAYKAIGDAKRGNKDAAADRAFELFVATLPTVERDAFEFVAATLADHASEHRAAFVRSITPSK